MKKRNLFIASLVSACSFVFSTHLYSANLYMGGGNSTNFVYVLDTSTNTVVATVTVGASGSAPNSTAVTPNGLYCYAQTGNANAVYIIDTTTNQVVGTVSLSTTPNSVAFTPDGTHAYITCFNTKQVIGLKNASTSSPSIVSTITYAGSNSPAEMSITPDGNYGYVTIFTGGGGAISVLQNMSTDSPSLLSTISSSDFPVDIAITPDGNYAYVSHHGTPGPLTIIHNASSGSPSTFATVTVGGNPRGMAITPDGNRLYVGNSTDGTVSVIQNASSASPSVLVTLNVTTNPTAVAISQNGKYAYVADSISGNSKISVIQNVSSGSPSVLATATVPSTSAINSNPGMGIAAPHQIFVVDSAGSQLYMIDQTWLSASPVTLNLGSGLLPKNILLTQDRRHAYITQNGSNAISYVFLDYENLYPSTVKSTITVGSNPEAMTLSSDGSYVYVADSGNDSIYRIRVSDNTSTLIATLTSTPGGIGVDPSGNYLVVAMPSTNQVALIANPTGGSPSTSYTTVGSTPNSMAFNGAGDVYLSCSGDNTLYQVALSSGVATSLSLPGSDPGSMSQVFSGGHLYLLVAMQKSDFINVVDPSTFTVVASPTLAAPATQIIINPNTTSVAYLVEPQTYTMQSVDFTSSSTIPVVSSQVTTSTQPIGGGCPLTGSALYVLDPTAGSISAYTTSGTNQRTLTHSATVSSLGTPQGISVTP